MGGRSSYERGEFRVDDSFVFVFFGKRIQVSRVTAQQSRLFQHAQEIAVFRIKDGFRSNRANVFATDQLAKGKIAGTGGYLRIENVGDGFEFGKETKLIAGNLFEQINNTLLRTHSADPRRWKENKKPAEVIGGLFYFLRC